jgi:Flp pilus assembly protein TadD
MMIRGRILSILGMGLMLALGGCQTFTGDPPVETTLTVQEPLDSKYYPSDEPLQLGMEHFGRGDFGLAERYFRDAVEKTPKDATAWVGLAASYDRLRRFDLADQAYVQAIKLTGPTVQILNNQGYSMMLRGNMKEARRKFLQAYELDPTNITIINNLELLNSSRRFVQRVPGQL